MDAIEKTDEHGDFKVRLEMEENGENLDFPQEIEEDFFNDEMVDPFSTINDAGASENSEKLTAEMKRTLENANSENASMKSYARKCSGNQKLTISKTLSSLASASDGGAGPSYSEDQGSEGAYLFQQSLFNKQTSNVSAKSFINNSVFQNCSINVNVKADQE
uniref:Uncharacterized protein n=1 Tax=Magallana gigas TaxID=29159 RepID=A0A8W8KQ16_MAGGI